MEKIEEFTYRPLADVSPDARDALERWAKENSYGIDKEDFYLVDDGKSQYKVGFPRGKNEVNIRVPASHNVSESFLVQRLKEWEYILVNYPFPDDK